MPLYNQLNWYVSSGWTGFGSPGWDPQNTSVLSVQVKSLLCPSENLSRPAIGPGTRKNYVANIGGPANFFAWSGMLVPLKDNPPLDYAGVYWNQNSGTTFGTESVTDGMTNTAMFSETLIGTAPAGPVALSATTRKGTYQWQLPFPNFWDQGPQGACRRCSSTGRAWPCRARRCRRTSASRPSPGQRQHLAGRQRRQLPDVGFVQPLHAAQLRRAARPATTSTRPPTASSWTRCLRAATTPEGSISASPTGPSAGSRTASSIRSGGAGDPQRQRGDQLRRLLNPKSSGRPIRPGRRVVGGEPGLRPPTDRAARG